MSKELEVSLVNYLCPICGEVAEEGIIMNSLLSEKAAKEVKLTWKSCWICGPCLQGMY